MAQFDMRGQNVTNQYNAGRDMNFGTVQNQNDLVAKLEQLKEQVTREKEAGFLSEETATSAESQVTKAVQQASKPAPDKKSILDYLTAAKTLIEDATATSGLVTALVSAIESVHKVF